MLQQILKDMYIEPELLAELSDEQKQILFFKMREEQVRRWKEWNVKVEKQKIISGKKNGRNVNFKLDIGGNPWVWVMGEHKDDKSIEQILEEESLEVARKEAHKEAELKRLKEIEERKRIDEEERKKQKELKEEREKIAREKAALEEKARKIKEEEDRRKREEERRRREEEEVERQRKAKEEKERKERERVKQLEQKRQELRLKREKEEQDKQRHEKEQEALLKKLEEERLQKEKQAKEIKEQERQLQLQIEREKKENKQRDAKYEIEEKERTQEIFSTLQKKRRESKLEAEKNRDRIEQIWNVQLRKSKVADQDRSSWAQAARDTVRRSRISRDFEHFNVSDMMNHTRDRGPKPKNRMEAIDWYRDVELPKKAGFDLITNRPDTWMHGPMSRIEVESLLINKDEGTYLVRLSERIWGYTLSVKNKERTKHFLIDASLAGYQFFGTDQIIHRKLKDLVEYHTMTPISELGKEILKFPQGQTSSKPDYDVLL
ncbi:SH2 domain-containing protein 4B-like [Antedon mediterranea]|uniref:SH2 domain-containing protein 4B-like n=1 Tax=Antedon mediterranea TaxID=105859 RepID=UPI003AF88E7D